MYFFDVPVKGLINCTINHNMLGVPMKKPDDPKNLRNLVSRMKLLLMQKEAIPYLEYAADFR